jgi:hypothetical protein
VIEHFEAEEETSRSGDSSPAEELEAFRS